MWRRNPRTGIFTAAVLALSLASLAPPCHADYTATYNLNGLSAEALFKVVTIGGTDYLQLDLTSNTVVKDPAMVLTAVFFSLDGQTSALTGYSANVLGPNGILTLNSGYNGGVDNTSTPIDVSGEFAYAFDLGGIGGVTGVNGLGSTGLSIFPNTYDWTAGSNTNLFGPVNIDGADFGIVGSIASDANAGARKDPMIQKSARFLFNGLPAGFLADSSHINQVQFNFGTKFGPVPEPVFFQLGVLLGLAGLVGGIRTWKDRKSRQAP